MPKNNYGVLGDSYITPAQRASLGVPFTGAQYRYEVLAGGITPINPPPPPTSVAPSWSRGTYGVPGTAGQPGQWLSIGIALYEGDTVTIDLQGQTVTMTTGYPSYQQFTVGPNGGSAAGVEGEQRWYTGQNGRTFNLAAVLLQIEGTTATDTIFQTGEYASFTVGPPSDPMMPAANASLGVNCVEGSPVNIVTSAPGVEVWYPIYTIDRGTRNLTWSAPASPGGTITGYAVQYSSDGGANWSDGGVFNSTTADLSSLNLAPNTAYKIGVATITSNAGAGNFSIIDTITPPAKSGAPTSVTGSEGDAQVSLTWTQPSNTGTSAITDYRIQYSSNNGSTWTTFSDSVSNATSAVVTGLTNGTSYKFRVAAITASGMLGAYSAASSAYTPAGTPVAPGAPTGVSGTAGDQQVSLSWSAPSTNGGSAITDYVVQYSSNSGSSWSTFSDGTSTSTSAVVTGLTNGTAYTFRVAATNSVGTGNYSSASSAITPAAPSAPGAPTSVTGSAGNTQVSLSWTAPASSGSSAITDYVVQYSSDSGSSWSTFSDGTSTSTSAVVTGLTNGTAYTFRVAATNAIGTGNYSTASGAVTPAAVPGAPTSVSGTAGNAQVSLTWTAPSSNGGASITDYVVQYSSNSGSSWSTFSDGTSATASAVVTGLTNGTAYTFRVAAVNSVGTGSYSTASSSVTPTAGNWNFSSVALLMHMEGSGATFTDSSSVGRSITALGNSTQSTAQSRFGSKSWLSDGSGDYLTFGGGSTLTMGTGDFTIEMWLRLTSYAQASLWESTPIGGSGGRDSGFIWYIVSDGTVYLFHDGSNILSTSSAIIPLSQWSHVALSRASGTTRMYVDGSQVASTSSSYNDTAAGGAIGAFCDGGSFSVDGYIDEVRVSRGIARYSGSTLTVPTAAFPDSDAPGAPTSVTPTAGDASVSLSWTAPSNIGEGGAITDYVVQYSSNSGSSWTTFSDGTSATASANVTGLTNGTAYVFRVAATNAAGTGSYSTASSSATPSGGSFSPMAVMLTSGTSYAVPSGATSMKAWAVGGGSSSYANSTASAGGGGGCAYKTWSVSGGSTVTYSCGTGGTVNGSSAAGGNTTVTYGGATITGNGASGRPGGNQYWGVGGSYSGGDGGANGGDGGGSVDSSSGAGGAVGGNGTSTGCGRYPMSDVSGLKAALTLAGVSTTESCDTTAAFGSGGVSNKFGNKKSAGYGGGGLADPYGSYGVAGGPGAVVLSFS
jgi:hypothetical protein